VISVLNNFTSLATVMTKVKRCQISRSSTARFGFHIIDHYHDESWWTPNLRTISGYV